MIKIKIVTGNSAFDGENYNDEVMNIRVAAKRWFQKSAGNTYHSVKVYVNGELVEYAPFNYGYGESYLQTAHEILIKHSFFHKTGEYMTSGMNKDYYEFREWTMVNRDKFSVTCEDVSRRRDL